LPFGWRTIPLCAYAAGHSDFADVTGDRAESARAFGNGYAKSKIDAVNPEITRDQNHDNHDANDGKDVHLPLLRFHDDSVWFVRTTAIESTASCRHPRRGPTTTKQAQVSVTATAYIPNSRLRRIAETAQGQRESDPYLPPKYPAGMSLPRI
jgi:hypothetical protein